MTSNKNDMLVVVMDEDIDSRYEVAKLLKGEGVEVEALSSWREVRAFVKTSKKRPSVVLIDSMGLLLSSGYKEIPVVVLTGNRTLAPFSPSCKYPVLQKPITGEELVKGIRAALAWRRGET